MPNRHQTENYRAWDRPRDEYGRFESESDWERENRGYRERGGDRSRMQESGWRADANYGGYYGDRDSSRGRYGMQGYDDFTREDNRYRGQYDDTRYGNGSQMRDYGNRDGGWRGDSGYQSMGYADRDRSYGDSYQDQNGGNSYRTESVTGLRSNWGANGGPAMDRAWNQSSRPQSGGRGQFAGRGPKGYQRSDERIQEDVNEMLFQDSDLDASDIEVKVMNGDVTLTGTVSDRESKRRAEDMVERCSGVRDVHNQIRVQREQDSESEHNRQSQMKGKPATTAASKSNLEAKTA